MPENNDSTVKRIFRKLFGNAPAEAQAPTLEDIRSRIFQVSRDMEMRNRQAAAAEAKAQAALQKTFQPGIGAAQRQRLLHEHQAEKRNAQRMFGFANQLGGMLDTLESAETLLSLSETISKSELGGANGIGVAGLMEELQRSQEFLAPLIDKCKEIKGMLDLSYEQFGDTLSVEASAQEQELQALYDELDKTTDPDKRAELEAAIQKKTEAMLA